MSVISGIGPSSPLSPQAGPPSQPEPVGADSGGEEPTAVEESSETFASGQDNEGATNTGTGASQSQASAPTPGADDADAARVTSNPTGESLVAARAEQAAPPDDEQSARLIAEAAIARARDQYLVDSLRDMVSSAGETVEKNPSDGQAESARAAQSQVSANPADPFAAADHSPKLSTLR